MSRRRIPLAPLVLAFGRSAFRVPDTHRFEGGIPQVVDAAASRPFTDFPEAP